MTARFARAPLTPLFRGAQDGAARVLDPIFRHVNEGFEEYGNFYKDYQKASW